MQIKEPFTEANSVSDIDQDFGPVICCFLFKSNYSGILLKGSVIAKEYQLMAILKEDLFTFCFYTHLEGAQYKHSSLLKSSTGASRVNVLKDTLRVDVEELESVTHLVSPPT